MVCASTCPHLDFLFSSSSTAHCIASCPFASICTHKTPSPFCSCRGDVLQEAQRRNAIAQIDQFVALIRGCNWNKIIGFTINQFVKCHLSNQHRAISSFGGGSSLTDITGALSAYNCCQLFEKEMKAVDRLCPRAVLAHLSANSRLSSLPLLISITGSKRHGVARRADFNFDATKWDVGQLLWMAMDGHGTYTPEAP